MKSTFRMAVIFGFLVLAGGSLAFGQDWPQWRGPGRDAKATGFTAPTTWPSSLTPKWKVDVGSGDSSPALVGDKLYVFARQQGDEVTTCLDTATGNVVWSDKYAAKAPGRPSGPAHAGPRSSPVVSDGKVVTLGVDGVVSCLDASTGKLLWRNEEFTAVPRFFTSASPIVVDAMVIIPLGGDGNGTIVAFDLAKGDIKWKLAGDGPAYSSPVLLTAGDSKQIVTMTDKNIVGVSVADGKLLWKTPFAVNGMAYNAATPIVDGQTVIYTGQNRGTTAVKIEKDGDGFKVTNLWANPQVSTQFNTPVLKDGLLYGLSDKGKFFCIDAKTGQTDWVDTMARGTNYGTIVDAGPVLLALPSSASSLDLIAIKPDGKAYTEVAKIKVIQSASYAYPIVSGNKIFVKDQNSVEMLVVE